MRSAMLAEGGQTKRWIWVCLGALLVCILGYLWPSYYKGPYWPTVGYLQYITTTVPCVTLDTYL